MRHLAISYRNIDMVGCLFIEYTETSFQFAKMSEGGAALITAEWFLGAQANVFLECQLFYRSSCTLYSYKAFLQSAQASAFSGGQLFCRRSCTVGNYKAFLQSAKANAF